MKKDDWVYLYLSYWFSFIFFKVWLVNSWKDPTRAIWELLTCFSCYSCKTFLSPLSTKWILDDKILTIVSFIITPSHYTYRMVYQWHSQVLINLFTICTCHIFLNSQKSNIVNYTTWIISKNWWICDYFCCNWSSL